MGVVLLVALLLGALAFAGVAAAAPSTQVLQQQTAALGGERALSSVPVGADAMRNALLRGLPREPGQGLASQSLQGTVSVSAVTRYEDRDSYIDYAPSDGWAIFDASNASGGSYHRSSTPGASCTVTFWGTYLAWVATKGTVQGWATVSLDGGPQSLVQLSSANIAYQVVVWETGDLSYGPHTVTIGRSGMSLSGASINVDAFNVVGTLVDPSAAGTGSISGKVTNSGGTALANVAVFAWNADFDIVGLAVTASNGTYSLTGLPNVRLLLSTYNERNYIDEWYNNVRMPGNWDATGATWLDLGTAAARTGINFSLAAGKSISGYVHGADGGLVHEQEVAAYDLSGNYVSSGFTDDSGTYTIWGLPAGQYHIRTVNAPGYVDEWYNNDPVLTDLDGESATTINISTSNATGKNFVLAEGRIISGRVTDSLGAGLPDVRVALRPPSNDFSVYVLTDGDGYYDFDGLLLGQYLLNTFNHDGYVDEWYPNAPLPGDLLGEHAVAVDVSSIFQTGIDFALDKGYTISGTVVDSATGQALPDPGVMVEIVDGADTLYSLGFAADDIGKAYITWALPAGTYYVRTLDDVGLGYIDEWYNNKPLGVYNGADADPVTLSASNATGVNFGLDRMTRYEQTDPHIYYTPAWTTYAAPSASGGSYNYSSATSAVATVYFNGTRLDASVMMGTTTGSADFWVDNVKIDTVDLSASPAEYNVKVFTTDVLSNGPHKVEIKYTSTNASGKRITLDAVDVAGFLTYAVPMVTAVTPNTGFTLGGDSVVITGASFTGATAVTFGVTPAAGMTVNSATQITAVTPVHSAGTVQVQVTTPSGSTANTAADDFTFAVPGVPTITSLSPNTGSVDGGTVVTINGSNFAGLSGASAVTFGGMNATNYTVNSGTRITATAPAHAEGTVSVEVTAFGGTTADLPNDDFTYTTLPPVIRYDQTNGNIVETGTWADYPSPGSYGGSYGRSLTSSASATVWFTGTQIAYIAFKGTTTGYADVYIDNVKATTVNLTATSPAYVQTVWTSPVLTNGLHSFKVVRNNTLSGTSKYVTMDAVDITGAIAAPPIRYQQTDTHIVYSPAWSLFSSTSASGLSYSRSLASGASAAITFNGTRLDVIATKGTTTGIVDIYVDGAVTPTATIDLTATSASYQVMIYSTSTLPPGVHTVRLVRNSGSASTKYVTLDAVDIWGTIQYPPA